MIDRTFPVYELIQNTDTMQTTFDVVVDDEGSFVKDHPHARMVDCLEPDSFVFHEIEYEVTFKSGVVWKRKMTRSSYESCLLWANFELFSLAYRIDDIETIEVELNNGDKPKDYVDKIKRVAESMEPMVNVMEPLVTNLTKKV